jgi:hypothetical protein
MARQLFQIFSCAFSIEPTTVSKIIEPNEFGFSWDSPINAWIVAFWQQTVPRLNDYWISTDARLFSPRKIAAFGNNLLKSCLSPKIEKISQFSTYYPNKKKLTIFSLGRANIELVM